MKLNTFILAQLQESDVIFFGFFLLGIFILLVIIFFWSTLIRRRSVGISPYTGMPLRRASDLPYESAKKVLQFMYDKQEYDNRIFNLKKAALERETGRIYTNCISWYDTVNVNWDFLPKRFPGTYISWGSLSREQQIMIKDMHDSLEGFQTEISSPHASPREIENKYIYTKPGPLYVDVNTLVLIGWQQVPDTDFEVLIVQKPTKDRYR